MQTQRTKTASQNYVFAVQSLARSHQSVSSIKISAFVPQKLLPFYYATRFPQLSLGRSDTVLVLRFPLAATESTRSPFTPVLWSAQLFNFSLLLSFRSILFFFFWVFMIVRLNSNFQHLRAISLHLLLIFQYNDSFLEQFLFQSWLSSTFVGFRDNLVLNIILGFFVSIG